MFYKKGIPKTLWHRCFPVNFAESFKNTFLQNTSGRRFLHVLVLLREFYYTTLRKLIIIVIFSGKLSKIVLASFQTNCSSVYLAIQFVKNRQKLNSFSLLKSLQFGGKILQGTISLQKLSKIDSMNLIAFVVPILLHYNTLNLL